MQIQALLVQPAQRHESRTAQPTNRITTRDPPRSHPHVVLPASVIELSQSPVNQPQLPLLVVDHHVVGLDVPMHDALAVTADRQGCPKVGGSSQHSKHISVDDYVRNFELCFYTINCCSQCRDFLHQPQKHVPTQ
jgi:hypothetical protein